MLRAAGKASERSLEFNVIAAALEYIRRIYPNSYIIGYNTRQEADHGVDVSINANGLILAGFQFKAPEKRAFSLICPELFISSRFLAKSEVVLGVQIQV